MAPRLQEVSAGGGLDTRESVQNSDNIYNHQSMTMAGSQPGSEKSSNYPIDDRIVMENGGAHPNQNVTNRDLNSLHQNGVLRDKMLGIFNELKEDSNDTPIIEACVTEITKYLELS